MGKYFLLSIIPKEKVTITRMFHLVIVTLSLVYL